MITVRLHTGQVLSFPDGTPEEVIRRAREEVLSGEADRKRQAQRPVPQPESFDLSGLRPGAAPTAPVDDPRARTEARLRAALPAPGPVDPRPPAEERVERSPEWWKSVSGSPSSKAAEWADERATRLRLEARQRDFPAEDTALGLTDRGGYYEDEESGQRYRKTDLRGVFDWWRGDEDGSDPTRLDHQLDPGYRPLTEDQQRLKDLGAPYEQPDSPEKLEDYTELARAAVGGVPGRIAASEIGTLIPLQAAEAGVRGVGQEIGDLASGRLPQRTGESFAVGARRGWSESPITQAGETINREIIEPDREWLARAATAAGLSPEASAAVDTGQLIAGEVLNPGNYIGLDLLRSGAGVARRSAGVMERSADLEARGGARTISTGEGLVAREFGSGSAPTELAQMRRNRMQYRLERSPLLRASDAVRESINVPWRTHEGYQPRVPVMERPRTPEPFPRDMNRAPVQVPVTGSRDSTVRAAVLSSWDYASRRHPRLASTVSRIEIVPHRQRFADMKGSVLSISPDLADKPWVYMHELTHRAQNLRRGDRAVSASLYEESDAVAARVADLSERESTAIRRGEVYRDVPPSQQTAMIDFSQMEDRDLWQGYADAREAAVVARPGSLDRARLRSLYHAFDQEITDRAKVYRVRPEWEEDFWKLGDEFGGVRETSEELIVRTGGGLGHGNPDLLPDPDSESWFNRVSRRITQAADRLGQGGDRAARQLREQSETLPSGDVLHSRTFDMDAPGSGLRAPLAEERGSIPGQLASQSAAQSIPYADSRTLRLRNTGESGHIQLGPTATPPLDPLHVRLPEEVAAERMGWKLPDGDPRTTRHASLESGFPEQGSIDPITTPDGQTNIAAQVDPVHGYFGDPEVAGYVIEESDRIFRSQGPPQTWSTLEEMAVRRGLTTEQLLADRTHWNVMPPEVRLRTLYVIKGKEQARNELQAKLAAGTATDADKAELLHTIETIGDLTRLSAKTGSAYGRALNSLKMEARNALLEPQMMRQKIYKQYEKQIEADAGILDALARLDPTNPEELMVFQRLVDRPKFREYVQEYWIASVLSGPATHERNLIGNAVNAVMENAIVRPLAAGFDAARVGGTGAGAAGREIFLRETPEAIVGLTRGMRLGARRGLEVLKRGYPTNTHGATSGKLMPVRSAFSRSQNRVVREIVGPVVTMPLRLLSASDELFKAMNHTAELYAQAARAAAKSGMTGRAFSDEVARLVQNPTDDMIEAADSFALKATFNDETSAIGKAIMNLRDLPRVNPESRIGQLGAETYRGFAGFIIPFVRIADRLMVRGFEYTPIGAVKAVGARQSGNLVEAADLAARSAIGSVVMAYAGSLAMEGRLTAGAPTDERERAAFYAAGKQPWSVRTEDGMWIPYGGLQPVGTPFAVAAAAWKGWKEHGDAPDTERLGHAAAGVGQYVTDQSYMEGLSKFMEAIEGGEGAGRAFSNLAAGTIGGFAPYSGLQRSISQAIDPRVIDAKTIGDKLRRNVPGLSLSMQAKLTPWGEEVIPVGGRLRSVLAPGSILLPSQENEDPLDRELAELDIPLGNVGKTMGDKLPKRPRASETGKKDTDWLDRELGRLGMPLGYVDKKMSGAYGGGKSRGTWTLDDEEWYLYQQTAGRATRRVLERLFSRADYAGWDSERQRDEAERAIGAAREYARMWAVRYHRANRPRTVVEAD